MDSIQTLADRLAIYLAAYKHYVDVKSQARLLNGAIFGEPLAMDLATIAFGYKDLENLNLGGNAPAIDLGSASASCAIQVTLFASTTKVIETQQKIFKHGLDKKYTKLKFICLKDKQTAYESRQIILEREGFKFDPEHDIYDLRDLFKQLVTQPDPEKFESFCNRLEVELGSVIRPYLLGVDLPGQNLRRLFDEHDVRITDAVKALEKFNVSRAVIANNLLLAEAASRDLVRYVAEQFQVSGDWIEGVDDHIYSGGPGVESCTSWRRNLRDAHDLIERVHSSGEKLQLIIPLGLSLCDLDANEDVVDHNHPNYEHFYLVAQKQNDFLIERYRMVIGDPLSYQHCRQGILLLFLATTLYEMETQRVRYIDVIASPREDILACYEGSKFLTELGRSGQTIDNHKDYFYTNSAGALIATPKVPKGFAQFLQDELTDFVARRAPFLPASIQFS